MRLNELSPANGSKKKRKRIGRGVGSGHGTTAGRGSNGHNSRSGGGVRPGFEGGQMPIHRRLPKRGFTNIFKKKYRIINVLDLIKFDNNDLVDRSAILAAGFTLAPNEGIKLLAKGNIDKPLIISLDKVSKSAKIKVEAVGGRVDEVI